MRSTFLLLSLFIFQSSFSQVDFSTKVNDLPKEFFSKNRDNLREMMPDRSVAVFFSGVEKVKSNDVNFPFFQDPNFYYLTGFKEADALLMIFKEPYDYDGKKINEMIFVPGKTTEHEIWHGSQLGTKGVVEELGIEPALVNHEFADVNFEFDYFDHILYHLPYGVITDNPDSRGDLASMLKHFNFKTDSLKYRREEDNLVSMMEFLREIKTEDELVIMQRAIDITCEAHKELMKSIDESYNEYNAEALIEYTFRNYGAEGPGFPSIVGGGGNSCVLHYTSNNAELKKGDLLVVDIGAQYGMYSADITRTIPVSGAFTEEQKIIYELVLEAQQAGIEACKPGNKFWDPHIEATQVIERGLKSLGITKKSYQARKYFMHGTSHYLGLDVHDAGSYQSLRKNNVITVEPGIYIPEGSDCDEKWWNIGIRIEDDILITDGEPVNLSSCVPSEIEEIENLMKEDVNSEN